MEEEQQHQVIKTHVVGHHRRRGWKGNHLRVHGHGGCCGGRHGHKHRGRHGHGHGSGRHHGHGHRHGFVLGQEQIEHGGQMIVAHASGSEQPEPAESFRGEMNHHRRRCRRRQRHCHRHGHGQDHHPYHCDQVTETGAPNELSGAMVRMHLEDEPKE